MDLTTLLLYAVAVSAVTAIPGPTMLLALNNGVSGGPRIAACGILGAALSDLILIGAVGCGLGAVLAASERLFACIKWGGVLYLLYLAWGLWRAPVRAFMDGAQAGQAPAGGRAALLRSLLVALSNPKGLLFFSAFLPQFIQPGEAVAAQYATLAVLTAAIDAALMAAYALGGHHAARLMSARALRCMNRGCAGLLAALAVALSLYRRSESR